MAMDRRTFFKLGAATVAMASMPSAAKAALTVIEDDTGGWLPCHGQALSRSAYPDLFALMRDHYGADDNLTFKLPDLRGRVLGYQKSAALEPIEPAIKVEPFIKVRRDETIIPLGIIRYAAYPCRI